MLPLHHIRKMVVRPGFEPGGALARGFTVRSAS